MVLLAHPPITNAQHSLRDSTNDPARAQTLREPRFREPSVVRGKQPPHHLGTAIKCPLWIPSIDATVPQALARGNESLAVRARRGQLSENDGRISYWYLETSNGSLCSPFQVDLTEVLINCRPRGQKTYQKNGISFKARR